MLKITQRPKFEDHIFITYLNEVRLDGKPMTTAEIKNHFHDGRGMSNWEVQEVDQMVEPPADAILEIIPNQQGLNTYKTKDWEVEAEWEACKARNEHEAMMESVQLECEAMMDLTNGE